MKIIIALYKYFYWGGLQKDTLRLIDEAISRGHQVTVFTADWPDPPAYITVEKVDSRGWSNVGRMKYFTKMWLERLKRKDYDVSVAMNRIPGADFYFVADSCMAEYYSQKHSRLMLKLNPRYRYILDNERDVVGPDSSTRVMCIAQNQVDAFRREYQLSDQRLILLPPGMNPDCVYPGDEKATEIRRQVRQELGIPNEAVIIVSVGANWLRKGLDRTASALASQPDAQRNNLHWIVVGDAAKDKIKEKLAKYGLGNISHLTGPRQDVNRLLLASDLMVHPAREEGTGTVLVEAIASHVPVICTGACGFSNYVAESGGIVTSEPFAQNDLNLALNSALSKLPDMKIATTGYASQNDFTTRTKVFVDELEKIKNRD